MGLRRCQHRGPLTFEATEQLRQGVGLLEGAAQHSPRIKSDGSRTRFRLGWILVVASGAQEAMRCDARAPGRITIS